MTLALYVVNIIFLQIFALNNSESSLFTSVKSLPSPVVKDNGSGKLTKPTIIAHRGASGMFPEHTKLAYRYTLLINCLNFCCVFFIAIDNNNYAYNHILLEKL